MRKIQVEWSECGHGGAWCNLQTIDLHSPSLFNDNGSHANGVYIIWSPISRRVVRVGSGDLIERISEHQETFRTSPYLKVTFAGIDDENIMLRIERYLGYVYNPEIGERFPAGEPVAVNLPNNGITACNDEWFEKDECVDETEYMLKIGHYHDKYIEWNREHQE